MKITVLSNKDTENKTFKQEIFLSSNDYMDDSLADIKTTVKTAFLYDEEKGLTIQNAQRVFGNKY